LGDKEQASVKTYLVVALCALGLMLPVSAQAQTATQTNPATDVTNTSATLHGYLAESMTVRFEYDAPGSPLCPVGSDCGHRGSTPWMTAGPGPISVTVHQLRNADPYDFVLSTPRDEHQSRRCFKADGESDGRCISGTGDAFTTLPETVRDTDPPTHIGARSAILHGTVEGGGFGRFVVTDFTDGSEHLTPWRAISGTQELSETISGLDPDHHYHVLLATASWTDSAEYGQLLMGKDGPFRRSPNGSHDAEDWFDTLRCKHVPWAPNICPPGEPD
jgi:hypothetical protein